MKVLLPAVLVTAFVGWAAGAPTDLEVRIEARIRSFAGTVSLYAKNLDTGVTCGIEPDRRVRTASTIKLPIMVGVHAAVQQGKASWADPSVLRAQDKVGGSGILRELQDGTRLTLRDLVNLMIVVSDNTATNLVLERVPADFVNAEMDKLGLTQTRALRKVAGQRGTEGHSREGKLAEFARYGLGVTTPREMVTLIEKLERGQVVSADASREMLDTLRRQQAKDGIGRKRAHETSSKSGTLDTLRSDAALVRTDGGRIAIAITVDDMPVVDYSPDNAGTLLIAELSELVVSGLSVPVEQVSVARPERVVALDARIDHVQGIDVDGSRLWLSWVNRQARSGHLAVFDLDTGKLIRSTTVSRDVRFHPGGIALDRNSILVPVAEYRRRGSTSIQRRDRETLELQEEFSVADHIGCIAAHGDSLWGANWDAQLLYRWSRDGRQHAVQPNPSGTSYQDLKLIRGSLVGSGLRGGSGAVDWLDPMTLDLRRRLTTGKTDRGVVLTHEGMAIQGGRIYFVPEDGPSRVLIYPLPW